MKKLFIILCSLMCLASTECFAQQEVRGISTKRITYNDNAKELYGWELTNHNSIPVSVDIELWHHVGYNRNSNNDYQTIRLTTESIVLNSNETYIFKYTDFLTPKVDVKYYYITYKAHKLE